MVRRRLGLRQVDVADRAGVAQSDISDLERGRICEMRIDVARRCFRVIDGALLINAYWRGAELDRLLDEGHAAIVGAVVRLLGRHGWVVEPEVTFAVYGERGSIDVLAWHASTRTLLVVEVKTEIASVEETIRRHDAKVRLAPGIWRERTGAEAGSVASLLVVADASTNRRRIARHADVFGRRYPSLGRAVRRWLARPAGPLHGLLYLDVGP